MKKQARISFGKVLITLGLILILGAGGLLGYNAWLDHRAGEMSETAAVTLVEEIQSSQVTIQEVESEAAEEETPGLQVTELDGAYYMGILTIPKLGRQLPVQSDWSMPQLKRSPCRYSGSLTDGELVIAAHNYKKHFSGLGTLSKGDSVTFTDLEGTEWVYEVQEVCTIQATDIEGMVNSGYDLSLFTCNYGGKARVTVRCSLAE